jgi:hypothetical protein
MEERDDAVVRGLSEGMIEHLNEIVDDADRLVKRTTMSCTTKWISDWLLSKRESQRRCRKVDANSSSPASETPATSPTCQTRCRPVARSTDLAGSLEMLRTGDQVGATRTVLVDVPFCPESARCADIARLRIRARKRTHAPQQPHGYWITSTSAEGMDCWCRRFGALGAEARCCRGSRVSALSDRHTKRRRRAGAQRARASAGDDLALDVGGAEADRLRLPHAGHDRYVVEFLDRVLEAQPLDRVAGIDVDHLQPAAGDGVLGAQPLVEGAAPRRCGCGAAATARSPRGGRRRRARAHSRGRTRPA